MSYEEFLHEKNGGHGTGSKKKTVQIYDCRPQLAAFGNKFSGKGYENSDHYSNMNLTFHEIENAPTMGKAHKDLNTAITNFSAETWCDGLCGSKWVQYLGRILTMTETVITGMKKGTTA